MATPTTCTPHVRAAVIPVRNSLAVTTVAFLRRPMRDLLARSARRRLRCTAVAPPSDAGISTPRDLHVVVNLTPNCLSAADSMAHSLGSDAMPSDFVADTSNLSAWSARTRCVVASVRILHTCWGEPVNAKTYQPHKRIVGAWGRLV